MKNQPNQSIYKQTQRFADVTKAFIVKGNVRRAKRCLQIAENAFVRGNQEIQNAITNVYVFSLSSFLEIHHFNIGEFLPKNLQDEYHKQINAASL
jgi:hypothetical protein